MKKKHVKKKSAKPRAKRKMNDYKDDPFFVRKDEQADAFLRKHGFPEELLSQK
ncbi:MAG TPA: hypothetical protein VHC96_23980 [Puia sp.]|nr:hypothetical protein [Puia sp.]